MALCYLKKNCAVILVDFCHYQADLFQTYEGDKHHVEMTSISDGSSYDIFSQTCKDCLPYLNASLHQTLLYDFRIMVLMGVAFLVALVFGIVMYRKKREAQCASSANGRTQLVSITGIKKCSACLHDFFL